MATIQGSIRGVPETPLTGEQNIATQGDMGELVTAPLRGVWSHANRSGNLFLGSTAAAGTTIPVSSATAATFGLLNPLGSNVTIELVSYQLGIVNATMVVSPILLGLISNLTVNPTALTLATMRAAQLGGNAAPTGRLFTAGTLAAAATDFYAMFSIAATTGQPGAMQHEFNGRILLAPGSLVHVVGTAAQTSPSAQTLVWAEWPR
jgi:hypothetical protein